MRKINAGDLFAGITGLSNMAHRMPASPNHLYIPLDNHEAIKKKIALIRYELSELGLSASLASANKLQEIILGEVEFIDLNGQPHVLFK